MTKLKKGVREAHYYQEEGLTYDGRNNEVACCFLLY